MCDPSDVRLVDPHAKRNRRHNNQPVFAREPCFNRPPILGFHSAVIKTRAVALLT